VKENNYLIKFKLWSDELCLRQVMLQLIDLALIKYIEYNTHRITFCRRKKKNDCNLWSIMHVVQLKTTIRAIKLKTTINLAMIISTQKIKCLTEMIVTNVLLIAFIQHFSLFGCRLTSFFS